MARLQGFGTTIFAEMSALAEATGSINLGQGFPDTDGPLLVKETAMAAIRDGINQYPPGPGTPDLRRAIAEHQKRFYDIELDPDSQILVTAGATEAIASAVLALCEPGDEVICFEPFYDSYGATIAMAGGVRQVVPLQPPEWSFDPDRLEAAVSDKTRLLLLNSPHNPTGKVFSDTELAAIADIAIRHDLIVITDEVYEHLIFDGHHRPLSTLPGMWARTVTISSAGKTFSFTGWKIGWATGPAELVSAVRTAKQFLTYVGGAPFQPAVAAGLRMADEYYAGIAWDLREKRDRLCAGLIAAGFSVNVPAGTYFVVVDTGPLGYLDGAALCREMPARCGVVGVPASAFYADPSAPTPLVRFAFCKQDSVLDEAAKRLSTLRPT